MTPIPPMTGDGSPSAGGEGRGLSRQSVLATADEGKPSAPLTLLAHQMPKRRALRPEPWTRRRWGLLLALVVALQLASIYLLSDRSQVRARAVVRAPVLRLAGQGSAELLVLGDPTLFALPRQQGFSGPAWMNAPGPQFQPADWSEAPRWLQPVVETLGAAFSRFMQTNRFAGLQIPPRPQPRLTLMALPSLPRISPPSTLQIEGGLERRRLLQPLILPSWTTTNILRDTEVQLLVDADGWPISVNLRASCGWEQADQQALALAKTARFEPLSPGGPGAVPSPNTQMTWGQMVFEWQTVPAPETAPPPGPPPDTPQP